MRRVHKDLARTVSAIISISMVTVVALTACTVNMSRLNDGLNDLSDSISGIADNITVSEATVAPTETTEAPTEETETTAEATPTATPTPTSTPTPTATPSPTPQTERVDFSFLSDEEIGNSFKVYKEDFKTSGLDDKGNVLAETTGSVIRVECESKNVQEAINCMLQSFSKRAEGAFSSYYNKALAASYLTGLTDETYVITQDMAYSDNGRLLSVVMHYFVTGPDGIVEDLTDYATFDMLTGQYITIPAVSSDREAFEKILGEKLIYAFMNPVEQLDDDQDAADGKKENDNRKPQDHEVSVIFIAAQKPGAETATAEVYGLVDGELCHTTVNLNDFESYLNSFGKIVFMVGQDNAGI